MSAVLGTPPEPRIVSLNQEASGVARMVLSIPMVFQKGSASVSYPIPQTYPDIPGFGFAGAQGKEDASGSWSWEITYEGAGPLGSSSQGGIPTSAQPDQTTYAFEPSDLDLSITIHPRFEQLKAKYGWDKDNLWFPETPPSSGSSGTNGSGTGSNIVSPTKSSMFMVESYLSFAGTWTKTYSSSGGLPSNLFLNVEQIVSSVPQPQWLVLPSIGAGRNWLKKMPSFRIRGKSVEVSEIYLLSGLGGWNPDVYSGMPR